MGASRFWLRVLLGIAFAITMGLHLVWCWTTFRFLMEGERIPNVGLIARISDRVTITKPTEELEKQGVRAGDRVVSIDGVRIGSRGQAFRVIRGLAPETEIAMEFARGAKGERMAARWPSGRFRKEPFSMADMVYAFFTNVFTPGMCIGLGFFVLWRRPENRLAWLLVLMLYGLSQIARFNGVFRMEYPVWMAIPIHFLVPFGTIVWPAAWLWFCLDFPEPGKAPRWLSWTRWVVGPLGLFFGCFIGVESVLNGEFATGFPFEGLFELLSMVQAPYVYGSAMGGLLALGYKLVTEKDADARRRLRLLVVGLTLGMGPLIVALIYGFERLGSGLQLASVLMLIFIPVSVGYVLIVERALDVGVVIRQGLQYAAARRSAMVLQALVMIGLMLLVFTIGADQMTSRPMRLTVIALAFGSVFLIQRLVEVAQRWIDRRFFREAVNAEHLLAELSEQVRTMVEPEALIGTVKQRIAEALHIGRVEYVTGAAEWAELRLPVRTQSAELGVLALGAKRSEEPYSPSEIRLLESVATQTAFALENAKLTETVAHEAAQRERIHREIEIAREVQERLLPKRAPEVEGLEIAGVCIPAQAIGGDYFDYLQGANGEVGFAIGDIAGKGIPASLLMASLQASLRGLIAGGVRELPELMAQLNRLIYEATPKNRFATFFYAWYEPAARVLRCGCAGHNAALLVRADGAGEWVKPKGLALGLTRVAKYEEQRVELREGDVLVLYTDGVTEAMNPERAEFGEERLEAAVRGLRGQGAHGMLEGIVGAVREFVREAPAHDDLTVVVVGAREGNRVV